MKPILLKSGLLLLGLTVFALAFRQQQLLSTPPQKLKVTLSNPQLSYFAILGSGNTANDTLIRIGTGGPSKSTANLFVGDTLSIGISAGMGTYVVSGIASTNAFNINVGVSNANLATGAVAIATRSAVHTLTFNPAQTITGGKLQYLVRATSTSGESASDRIPDQYGFDLGGLTAGDVTCPYGTASVGTTLALTYGNPAVTQSFHVIECTLGAGQTSTPIGLGGTGATTTITIGNTNRLINPSRQGASEGSSDIYTYFLREFDSNGAILESTMGKLAVIENVRVTATVDPTLTFTIDSNNVGIGGTPCGLSAFGNNAAATTATTISFGSVRLGAFNDLAHHLSAVTNANNGYAVTVQEIRPMTSNVGDTLADTNCDGACTTTSSAAWVTDNSHSEWGYTIHNINVGTTSMHYTQGYRPFSSSNGIQIMGNVNTPTATEEAYICYRLTASTTQEAGSYENHLIFTATATF